MSMFSAHEEAAGVRGSRQRKVAQLAEWGTVGFNSTPHLVQKSRAIQTLKST